MRFSFKEQVRFSQTLELDLHSSRNRAVWRGRLRSSCASPPCYTEGHFHGYQLTCLQKKHQDNISGWPDRYVSSYFLVPLTSLWDSINLFWIR